MKYTDYTAAFEALGLSRNEARVYAYALTHDSCVAQEISTALEITRTNTYHILDQLIHKKLLSTDDSLGKRMFHAEHPDQLVAYLDAQEKTVQQKKIQLESMMQQLTAEYLLAQHRPGVFRFAGKEGLMKVYNDIIQDRVDICSIQNREAMRKFIPVYNDQWLAKRKTHNLFHRIISVTPHKIITTPAQDENELRAVKYVDPKQLPWDMDLKITPKKIVMTTFHKNAAVGISIIDPIIVKNYNFLFEFFWTMLP